MPMNRALPDFLGLLKGFHDIRILDFFPGRVVVEIEDLDVVEPEALEADVELVQVGLLKGLADEALHGPVPAAGTLDFGRDHVRIARPSLDDLTDHLLVLTALVAVGRVEHEDAGVEGGLDDGGVVGVHDAHADDGDLEARLAEGPDDRLRLALAGGGCPGPGDPREAALTAPGMAPTAANPVSPFLRNVLLLSSFVFWSSVPPPSDVSSSRPSLRTPGERQINRMPIGWISIV